MPLRRTAFLLTLALAAAGCKPQTPPPPDTEGLAVHQTLILSHAGDPAERRIEVLEDARISPALRYWLWGGSKEPRDFLRNPGVAGDKALAAAMQQGPLRRGLVRLVDRDGKLLDYRRLDCELGTISLEPKPQSDGPVWTLGDDCSTGSGDYAGLITHFFRLGDDKIAWQHYTAADGESGELTVVQARRIAWRPGDPPRLEDITEVSSHPDFDDPRFKALKPDEPMPPDLPLVTDFIRYRYTGGGVWQKQIRTAKSAWFGGDGFPGPDQFPG
jgi:hypothetical protein